MASQNFPLKMGLIHWILISTPENVFNSIWTGGQNGPNVKSDDDETW